MTVPEFLQPETMFAWPQAAMLYAGLLAPMLVVLALRVVAKRFRYKVGMGDGGHADLAAAIRVHANFVEYVPMALVLLALVELAGWEIWILHGLGGALVAARLAHAIGLTRSTGASALRVLGTAATLLVLLAAGGLCLFAAIEDLFLTGSAGPHDVA